MFKISGRGTRLCDGITRREMLRIGGLASTGLTLGDVLRARAAVIAGGGFNVGQVIGETDAQGGRSKGTPYTPSNVLASLYRHLGIDPATTIPDLNKRPMHLLDDREGVKELESA